MKVLLKPNLLSARLPEDGVDTHPEVVRAVIRLVKAAGGEVKIGDSPGGYHKDVFEVFEKSGMKKIAEDEGAELVRFTSSKFVEGFPIARQIFDCDAMISIPKLKTHIVTVITAAIKNTYGTVTGLYKAECHSKAPREEDFARIVAKIHSISRPHLNILDAIVAMEGDGPSSGILRNMGIVMASTDAVAMDSCIAKLIGLEPLDVLVTKEAYAMGLGEADLSKIEITGDDIKTFDVSNFKLPQTLPIKYIPRGIANSIASLVKFRPAIDRSVCRRCNLCKVTCPVSAIGSDDKGYYIDYAKCVGCMCCHEVCPYRAIGVKRNILTKMVWG
ncbi:MAG: DUF362 domain-containing protein [Candidatus Omnitrophica bacterium]|nr:DUF362 domain-containing protein [Candidatus Omnitrophota bacterium]